MEEAKLRIDCIGGACQGRTGLPEPMVREFCYLQLRLLCELISLACMVAHGDIPATYSKQLGKQWSAEEIINALEKLRPHFYPVPIRQTVSLLSGTQKNHRLEAINPQPFTKETLLELYGKTHQFLHRGNVKKLRNSETPLDLSANVQELIAWAQKINDQLDHHMMAINEDELFICMLRNKDNNFRVQVVIAERKTPP